MIVSEGQLRTRRSGRVTIELSNISKLFAPGHRIGLYVTSSSFPKLEPLPVKSRNTVFHEGGKPSWVELPVLGATR
jgi:predicted acyl esterase